MIITFLTISYNQKNYIIEHLESIKYQIEHYGEKQEYKFILSDDCSNDGTVDLVKKWIKANNNLFIDVKILTSDENLGVVQNYLRGASYIDTKIFKILAGDDLYFKNNICEVIECYDVVFTPIITFGRNGKLNCESVNLLLTLNKIKDFKKLINIWNFFNAPGSFMTTEVVNDSGLRKFMSSFKWIEDAPQWYYLLNYKKNLNVKIKTKPYILYRNSDGISMNKENSKFDAYTQERNLMNSKLKFKLTKYPKFINLYRYYVKYLVIKSKYFDAKFNKKVIQANEIIKNEIIVTPDYLKEIRKKSFEFYISIGEEELYNFAMNYDV